jgi:F0F1-type ATP synthase assembly protein I
MVAGPLVGYFIGDWLDKQLGTLPYLTILLIVLGCISSGREVYKLLKWVSDAGEDSENDNRV